MRENRSYGSEGGAGHLPRSYPYQNLRRFDRRFMESALFPSDLRTGREL